MSADGKRAPWTCVDLSGGTSCRESTAGAVRSRHCPAGDGGGRGGGRGWLRSLPTGSGVLQTSETKEKVRHGPRRKDEHRTKQKSKHQGNARITEMVRINRQGRAQGKGSNSQASFPNGRGQRPCLRARSKSHKGFIASHLSCCTAEKSTEQAQTKNPLTDPHVRLRRGVNICPRRCEGAAL